jgi:hypothetical protein
MRESLRRRSMQQKSYRKKKRGARGLKRVARASLLIEESTLFFVPAVDIIKQSSAGSKKKSGGEQWWCSVIDNGCDRIIKLYTSLSFSFSLYGLFLSLWSLSPSLFSLALFLSRSLSPSFFSLFFSLSFCSLQQIPRPPFVSRRLRRTSTARAPTFSTSFSCSPCPRATCATPERT